MIVAARDILEVERLLQREHAHIAARRAPPDERENFLVDAPPNGDASWMPEFISSRPHLLFALGFDTYKVLDSDEERAVDDLRSYAVGYDDIDFSYEALYRSESSGAWFFLDGIEMDESGCLAVHMIGQSLSEGYSVSEWLDRLGKLAKDPGDTVRGLCLPNLWAPTVQRGQILSLKAAAERLLADVASGRMELRGLHWRELEELVAELLRSRGMAIHLTPRSHDSGRDIIARGELVPGEPIEIAIEVKQKEHVGIGDLREALYANRHFPALMVATAGRFSAGVVSESCQPNNRMRLLLKDGVALSQWIDLYHRGSTSSPLVRA